jgi:hypothetical protein
MIYPSRRSSDVFGGVVEKRTRAIMRISVRQCEFTEVRILPGALDEAADKFCPVEIVESGLITLEMLWTFHFGHDFFFLALFYRYHIIASIR